MTYATAFARGFGHGVSPPMECRRPGVEPAALILPLIVQEKFAAQ